MNILRFIFDSFDFFAQKYTAILLVQYQSIDEQKSVKIFLLVLDFLCSSVSIYSYICGCLLMCLCVRRCHSSTHSLSGSNSFTWSGLTNKFDHNYCRTNEKKKTNTEKDVNASVHDAWIACTMTLNVGWYKI